MSEASPSAPTRKLAAIMFTDIVGYTEMMGRDEKNAMALVQLNREIHTSLVAKYHGTLIKEMGDGNLISFDTSSDAVHCARDLQDQLKDDDQLQLRIGIHLGEIMVTNDDVFGDGVNIASRIQYEAAPGGICVSQAVYNSIRGQSDLSFTKGKKVRLKNVDYPVQLYAYSKDGKGSGAAKSLRKYYVAAAVVVLVMIIVGILFFPSSPAAGMEASEASVAILPFNNFTGREDLDHYGFGLASELRTQLAVNKQFDFVSSMQATMAYRNSNEKPQMIGDELGVTHIVTGMYQGNENDLQVVVELVEASTGKIVWSVPYKSKYEDLFVLQTSISEIVMERFSGKNITRKAPTMNMRAYAELTRGIQISESTPNPRDRLKAIPYFEKAIQLDSGLLLAWVHLIENYAYHYWLWPHDTTVVREDIDVLMDYVEQNFDESWEKNEVRGIYAYWVEKDYDKGAELFLNVLEVNPDSPHSLELLGAIYRRKHEYATALKYKSRAVLIGNTPVQWLELGQIFKFSGDVDNALIAFENGKELNLELTRGYYQQFKNSNQLEKLPDHVKNDHNRYHPELLLQNENYNGLLTFLRSDSNRFRSTLPTIYFKTLAYHLMKQDDSARLYARQFQEEALKDPDPLKFWLDFGIDARFQMAGILDEEPESWKWAPVSDQHIEQDLQLQVFREMGELNYRIFNRDYDAATKKLQEINRNYPKWGHYNWLNLPQYRRIKEEYPPFQEAVDNLKLPPLVSETNVLKM